MVTYTLEPTRTDVETKYIITLNPALQNHNHMLIQTEMRTTTAFVSPTKQPIEQLIRLQILINETYKKQKWEKQKRQITIEHEKQ